jgi:hypothetical protein
LPAAPALSTWIRRAGAKPFAARHAEQALAALCGIDHADAPPVAALSYLEDFEALPEGYCLRADPVHLRADTTGLILFDADSLALGGDESRALIETLAPHLADEGWTLSHRVPQRWYVFGGPVQDLRAVALPEVRGRAVATTHFAGDDAGAWVRRLNEIQMIMHNHEVNRARAAAGQPVVNSLWLWGGGGSPRSRAQPHCSAVVADAVFARGAARHCGLAGLSLPATADDLAAASTGPAPLVLLEDCDAPAAYGDIGGWLSALQRLERDWFAPLLQLLRRGRIDALQLAPLNGSLYRLTRRQLWSFWKGKGDYRAQSGFR